MTADIMSELEEFKASLAGMGASAADAAAAQTPLPWPREIGWTIRQGLITKVDQLLASEYGHGPIEEFRTIAAEAFDARCDEIYHAWFAAAPGTSQQ